VVLRDHALERTLGGGRVVDNRPATGRRRAPPRIAGIEACRSDGPGAALDALLAIGPVHVPSFRGLWNHHPQTLDGLFAERPLVRTGEVAIAQSQWRIWSQALANECHTRLHRDPSLPGLRENEFTAPVPAELRGPLLTALAGNRTLEQHGGRYRPPGHQVSLDPFERNTLDRLTPLLDQAQPPSLGDLARTLKEPLPKLQKLVQALAGKGELVIVSDKRIYLPRHLAALADVADRLSANGAFTARDFRDAAAIGRNVAIEVLEFFDGRGFNRRQGETRTVVGARSRLAPTLG
jgi:selenocysteine-specific elongation factor